MWPGLGVLLQGLAAGVRLAGHFVGLWPGILRDDRVIILVPRRSFAFLSFGPPLLLCRGPWPFGWQRDQQLLGATREPGESQSAGNRTLSKSTRSSHFSRLASGGVYAAPLAGPWPSAALRCPAAPKRPGGQRLRDNAWPERNTTEDPASDNATAAGKRAFRAEFRGSGRAVRPVTSAALEFRR